MCHKVGFRVADARIRSVCLEGTIQRACFRNIHELRVRPDRRDPDTAATRYRYGAVDFIETRAGKVWLKANDKAIGQHLSSVGGASGTQGSHRECLACPAYFDSLIESRRGSAREAIVGRYGGRRVRGRRLAWGDQGRGGRRRFAALHQQDGHYEAGQRCQAQLSVFVAEPPLKRHSRSVFDSNRMTAPSG
jgi:hypothetical protein